MIFLSPNLHCLLQEFDLVFLFTTIKPLLEVLLTQSIIPCPEDEQLIYNFVELYFNLIGVLIKFIYNYHQLLETIYKLLLLK